MLQLEIYVYPLVMFAEGWPEIWKYWTKNSAQISLPFTGAQ